MRVYVPVLVCFACFMYLITLTFSGCTSYPSYYGDTQMDGECADCHMIDGDGITPPGDHWQGEMVDSEHDACTQCHSSH